MRSNKNSVITIFSLFLAVILTAMLGSGNVRADDVDVYVTSAKNSAMVVIDDSGSMSWPVYEAGFDYSNFMYWMVEQGLANDSKTLGENLLGNRKADNDFWDKDKDNFSPRYSGRTKNKDKEYDRLDPDQIYLVSSPVWLGEVTYTDSGGQTKTVSQLDDVLAHASSHNERDDWLDNPIVVLRNAAGDVWRLPPVPGEDTGEDTGEIILDTQVDLKDLTIEVETVSEGGEDKYYILFPTTTLDICEDELPEGCKSSDKWYSVTNTFGGQRLKTNQDVRLTNLVVDPRTGIVTDYGFLGALRTAGYYFAGVFEKSGGDIDFTDNVAEAETVGGVARVYVFATGRWLNFIKLVEDFQADSPGTPTDTTWTFQETLAWTNICDKSGGTTEPNWTYQQTKILSFDKEVSNYGKSPVGDFLRGTIEPPGADDTGVSYIRVKFSYIDTEGCQSGVENDYVDLQDGNGNSLLAIKGQEIKPGTQKTDAQYSYDGGVTWNSPTGGETILDKDGYTEAINTDSIRVVWHKGKYGKNCSGKDKGFKITGFKFTVQDISDLAPGEHYCSNGDSGYGNKIRSRMEVAKAAMKRVIDATKENLYWGVTAFNESPKVKEPLGTDPDDVKAAVAALDPAGGTPMAEAMQDAYDSNYDYFAGLTDEEEAECSNKFIIAMTDGYPNGDNEWTRINTPNDGIPNFSDTTKDYVDDDGWLGIDGNENHGDDLSYWLYNNATYQHTVHTIGFTLQNPLLGDMADSSGGIYITAFNEGQLVNAFHSLSLAMTEAQSFVAPVVSVDQANRTQSGDKIYTAFFRPQEGKYWVGNLKKYGLKLLTRNECGRTQPELTVVGKDDNPATDCFGNFLPAATSIWSKVPDGGEAGEGGVGAVLKDSMPGKHPIDTPKGGPWHDFRNIYTYMPSVSTTDPVRFIHDNITNADLGVVSDTERYKIINFMYGYTYDVASTPAGTVRPTAKREWALGDIIHSEPTIIDYLNEVNELVARFIVVGANDGMVHVFTDEDISLKNASGFTDHYVGGREIWAFIPPEFLTRLQSFANPSTHEYFVDGLSSLHRSKTFNDVNIDGIRDAGEYYHKSLVFGQRRGGRGYWALDVTEPDPMKWKVKWNIQGGQGVMDPYNELSQSWSKPAFAKIRTGPNPTDLKDVVVFTGGFDPEEDGYPEAWEDADGDGVKDSGETHTDTVGGTASTYDYYNPDMNEYGRGIFLADLDAGTPVFKAVYAASDSQTVDAMFGTPIYSIQAMKWSFPADPAVISLSEKKLVIYTGDIYGQVWKVVYTYTDSGGAWEVKRVFEVNPGSDQTGATDFPPAPTLNVTDRGRKMFYAPDVSYRGTTWTDYPVLYFGTGDRAHPRYVNWDGTNGYHDRFYVVADTDSANPADETKLLNLTCDELEADGDVNQDGVVDATDDPLRTAARDILFGVTDYPVNGEQARGWYRVMGKQGECTQDSYDHVGEKVLSRSTLFFKITYFTTFRPNFGDICKPTGDALIYALDYDVGTAAFNLNTDNDEVDQTKQDLSDTYGVVEDSTIPSGTRVITRGGHAAGVFSAGGSVVGAGEEDGDGTSTSIPGPPGGASRMLWETF